ncbi:MAG: glycosyltransferase [Chitinophagaceae bacterium]|nr:MAG: glycosyltransferase [Chitinophagaceae bacterium]
MEKIKRIAIVVSHPIQHFCPQYTSWAQCDGVVLKVFFGSNLGAQTYFDKDFKTEISWDSLYLGHFEHEFLNGDLTLPPDQHLKAGNLEQKLVEFKPTLVVHYGYFQKLARQAYHWATRNGVELAYISDAEFRQRRPLWKRLLKFPYLFWYFKRIDHFLTVGDANEAYYRYYGVPAVKFKRMHFSLDLATYQQAWEHREMLRASCRQSLEITTTDIVLSVVGKLVTWKCQDHLIDLLQTLEISEPRLNFCLLIAGSGEEELAWKQKAAKLTKNKVFFLGFVKPEALPAIYAATDIYVHPALVEPHSLSISEAIYMGCPVIISHTCGSWGPGDDVQEGKNGLVYEHGNLQDLTEKLIKVIQKSTLEEMGARSHVIATAFQARSHGKVLKEL